MKTSLPAKSKPHQERINQIKDIILNAGRDKIAFIILFGSFAKGNWILDVKQESDGNTYEYASDYDFLIITKTPKQAKKINSNFYKKPISMRDITKNM